MTQFNKTMTLTREAQKVINSLKSGRQPAKATKKWIFEGLEQANLIYWAGIWKLVV